MWSGIIPLIDVKRWLIGRHPDAEKDQEQGKGATEQEMAVQHHQLSAHEFEQTAGYSEGQGSWRAAVHGVTKRQTHNSVTEQQQLVDGLW